MAFYPERRTVFDDLIDDVFDFPTVHGPAFGSLMKTDVHEKDGLYTLDIDLPGFRKEDIKITTIPRKIRMRRVPSFVRNVIPAAQAAAGTWAIR